MDVCRARPACLPVLHAALQLVQALVSQHWGALACPPLAAPESRHFASTVSFSTGPLQTGQPVQGNRCVVLEMHTSALATCERGESCALLARSCCRSSAAHTPVHIPLRRASPCRLLCSADAWVLLRLPRY